MPSARFPCFSKALVKRVSNIGLSVLSGWMAVGAFTWVVTRNLGVLGSHIGCAVAIGAGIGAVQGWMAGGAVSIGAAMSDWEGMVEIDRGPAAGVVALRALAGEVIGRALAGVAGLAIRGADRSMIKGCARPGGGGVALRALA